MNYKKIFLSILLICVTISAYPYQNGSRICWDYSTQRYVNGGGYARVQLLTTGNLALVYSSGSDIYFRNSSNKGTTWTSPVTVSSNSLYNYTNAELLELQNGWLLYTWNARPKVEGVNPYKIMCKLSKDKGRTWVSEQNLYTADNIFENGCWEPKALQLPGGEIQVYFANEAPYTSSSEQEISMLSSTDNCENWTAAKTICFRAGRRDGMPVPVYLKNNKGIAMAIEDNGINGTFKPVIISTTNNWGNAPVLATSIYRKHALGTKDRLARSIYAGAPYLIQLTNSETLLSIQSTEGRGGSNEVLANMQVYVGDSTANNFTNKSTPFPTLQAEGNALWNSLCQIDDSTVMAVASIANTTNQNGVWTVKGKIVSCPEAKKKTIVVDGVASNNEWSGSSSFPLKSYSNESSSFKTAWDTNNLYILFEAEDDYQVTEAPNSSPWEADGFEVYLDPQNSNTSTLTKGNYKILVNLGGQVLCEQSDESGSLSTWNPEGYKYQMTRTDDTYTIELAIPWQQLGGFPSLNSFGLALKFHSHTEDDSIYHEASSGTNPNRPSSWLKCSLIDEATHVNTPQKTHFNWFVKDKNLHVNFIDNESDNTSIRCTDLLGRVLYSKRNISQQNLEIPMQQYASGIYTFVISNKNYTMGKKFAL